MLQLGERHYETIIDDFSHFSHDVLYIKKAPMYIFLNLSLNPKETDSMSIEQLKSQKNKELNSSNDIPEHTQLHENQHSEPSEEQYYQKCKTKTAIVER